MVEGGRKLFATPPTLARVRNVQQWFDFLKYPAEYEEHQSISYSEAVNKRNINFIILICTV